MIDARALDKVSKFFLSTDGILSCEEDPADNVIYVAAELSPEQMRAWGETGKLANIRNQRERQLAYWRSVITSKPTQWLPVIARAFFDANGNCIGGQHKMTAGGSCGVPLRWGRLVFNATIPMATADNDGAPGKWRDTLDRDLRHKSHLQAVITTLHQLETGTSSTSAPHKSICDRIFARSGDAIYQMLDATGAVAHSSKLATADIIASLVYVFGVEPVVAMRMAETLRNLSAATPDSPEAVLLRALVNRSAKATRGEKRAKRGYVLNACYMVINGKTVARSLKPWGEGSKVYWDIRRRLAGLPAPSDTVIDGSVLKAPPKRPREDITQIQDTAE